MAFLASFAGLLVDGSSAAIWAPVVLAEPFLAAGDFTCAMRKNQCPFVRSDVGWLIAMNFRSLSSLLNVLN